MSRSVLAYSSHSCLGYSASSAVENCCVSVSKPHPKCSCEPSHCRQKHKKAALFVRKLVDLYLAPPYAHEWKVVKYEALTSCCMHGSSHSQLFVGFSMVHGTCIELRKKTEITHVHVQRIGQFHTQSVSSRHTRYSIGVERIPQWLWSMPLI